MGVIEFKVGGVGLLVRRFLGVVDGVGCCGNEKVKERYK